MTSFMPVSEYVSASSHHLRSEKHLIEIVIAYERFHFLDNFENQVCGGDDKAFG